MDASNVAAMISLSKGAALMRNFQWNNAAEHFKDHIIAEISSTKKRIIELGGQTVEEVWTDPLTQNAIVDEYTKKGI